ncbi:MAG: AAA family ATPase [Anaeroplasmataceae bacterium]
MIKDYVESQPNIKKLLLSLRHNNRLTHAYIFSGEKGVGKKEMALYFAAMLYCKDDEPCYTCQSCKQIFNHEHVNVYEISPDGNNIKKGQIEALQEEFSKTSLVSGPRVYIIDDADKMNVSSANSLLKFIEEPSSDEVYAILLTTDITNILPTIISRCGHIHFKSMSKDILLNMLVDKGLTEADAEIIKELTNSINDGIELSTKEIFVSVKALIEEFLSINNSYESIVYLRKNIDELSNANTLKLFLELLALVYEEMLFSNSNRFKVLRDKIIKYKEKLDDKKIKDDLKTILDLRKKIDSNVTPKNIVTNLFIELF